MVFLYQVRTGPAERSFGIHVAEMAGIPKECIIRARALLRELEKGNHHLSPKKKERFEDSQLNLFQEHPVVLELQNIPVEQLSPLEALNKLADLKNKINP